MVRISRAGALSGATIPLLPDLCVGFFIDMFPGNYATIPMLTILSATKSVMMWAMHRSANEVYFPRILYIHPIAFVFIYRERDRAKKVTA